MRTKLMVTCRLLLLSFSFFRVEPRHRQLVYEYSIGSNKEHYHSMVNQIWMPGMFECHEHQQRGGDKQSIFSDDDILLLHIVLVG